MFKWKLFCFFQYPVLSQHGLLKQLIFLFMPLLCRDFSGHTTKGGRWRDGKEGQYIKTTCVVDKRNIALMRIDEMYEMEVDCSM